MVSIDKIQSCYRVTNSISTFPLGCGEALKDRIVGGNATEAHAIPWQVGLVNSGNSRPSVGEPSFAPTGL